MSAVLVCAECGNGIKPGETYRQEWQEQGPKLVLVAIHKTHSERAA